MTMFLTLNLPDALPKSGTSGTYVDEPPSGFQISGLPPDYKPPAPWLNWWQNRNYEWAKRIGSGVLMNWEERTSLPGTLGVRAVLFHPAVGLWIVAHTDGDIERSVDGYAWTASSRALAASNVYSNGAIDTTRYIYPDDTPQLSYSADGVAWTTVSSGTIGGSGVIYATCTKYPDSDFMALCRGVGASLGVYIASSGVTGSWAAASTQPPSVPVAAVAKALIHTSGSTWLLLVNDNTGAETVLYKSVDDCDTWVAVTGLSLPATSRGAYGMAYDATAGRLVIVGSITTTGPPYDTYAAYSDDLGDSWTASVIDRKGIGPYSQLEEVYYCGGSCWIAVGTVVSAVNAHTVFVSSDGAETWQVADIHGSSVTRAQAIGCDGRKMLLFSDNTDYLSGPAI